MNFVTIQSPVGPMLLVADGNALVATHVGATPSLIRRNFPDAIEQETDVLKEARRQLKEYFAGKRTEFDLPLRPGGTEFQQSVWKILMQIPYGETRTYAQQAALLRKPKTVRAVGAANGKNPLGIIIPCHRVIGSNGSLTGYAGGLDVKKFLLDLETKQGRFKGT